MLSYHKKMVHTSIIGIGTTSTVVINTNNTVTKMFSKQKDYLKEKDILNHVNAHSNRLYRTVNMIEFDDNLKTINLPFIPYNLEEIIINETIKKLTEHKIYEIIIDIICILLYLHNNNITHGDFKAKNIQLDRELRPVIIDFGLSNYFHSSNEEYDTRMKEDIDKLWFLIIQLILKMEYKRSYTRLKSNLNEINKKHPRLIEIYNKSKYDIDLIADYLLCL